MSTLNVCLDTRADSKARVAKLALTGKVGEAVPTLYFRNYDDLHRFLTPARLAIVRSLVGQGILSIREVARRVDRNARAVHRDVTQLAKTGIIDHSEKGVQFPYCRIHFDFRVNAA